VLPDLAKWLRAYLRKMGEKELADGVPELRVYGRCCDASPCGRFYCLPKNERSELPRRGLTCNVGLELTVAKGRIVEVETCSPEVDAALKLVFPIPEYDNDAP
jgi:hypothetical protein